MVTGIKDWKLHEIDDHCVSSGLGPARRKTYRGGDWGYGEGWEDDWGYEDHSTEHSWESSFTCGAGAGSFQESGTAARVS